MVSTVATTTAIASDADMFCYMRTESGRLVNLGDVCGVEELPAPVTSSSATVSSSSSTALSNPEDIQAFIAGCTDSVLANGWTTTQANQYCGCAVQGIQSSGMSNDQFVSFFESLLIPNVPAPDLAVQDTFAEIIVTCSLAVY